MTAKQPSRAINFSKPVYLRSGEPVRILCTDRRHPNYVVIGLWTADDGTEIHEVWTREGKYDFHRKEHSMDLVQIPQPRKHSELIKKWADDDAVRIKCKMRSGWAEMEFPVFDPDLDYEEILPGDPLY